MSSVRAQVARALLLVAAAVVAVAAWMPTQDRYCERFEAVLDPADPSTWRGAPVVCVQWDKPFGTPAFVRDPRMAGR